MPWPFGKSVASAGIESVFLSSQTFDRTRQRLGRVFGIWVNVQFDERMFLGMVGGYFNLRILKVPRCPPI